LEINLIDADGYRSNVGIIVINEHKQALWARRCNNVSAWQFPQGGIKAGESTLEAMYRELYEELGLLPEMVEVKHELPEWYFYNLPKKFQRPYQKPLCIGQKQRWFLLQLVESEDNINLSASVMPEFSAWKWVDFWYPADHVIDFKQDVYRKVLSQFDDFLSIRG
jgi:putative (di)nucleoside polyphosphate hydrolase